MTANPKENITVLIVDDTQANLSLLEQVFSRDYSTMVATRGSEALKIAQQILPDIILLDIMMPEMDGYEVCERLKENPLLRDIPVIFLSALDSTDVKVKAFKSGGVDYVTKPFHLEELRARVKNHLMIRKLQLRLETQNQILEQTVAERTRLAMIVESSNDAIFIVSLNNIITSWNRGAEIIYGYSAEEIIGRQIFTLIPDELYHERAQILHTILSGGQIEHFETTRIRKDGSRIFVSLTTSPILDTEGIIIGNSVIARDVTERRKVEDIIKHQAYYDTLTELPNRLLFMSFLNLELAQAHRKGKKLALMFLDLNNFKQINDSLGHSCGDHLLQEVALRLKGSIRLSDTVARMGGDEFTVLMPDLAQTDDVGIVLGKIMRVFETPFMLDGVTVDTTASVGVCIYPDDGDCCEELMKNADTAMYKAKDSCRNPYQFFNSGINARTSDEVAEHRVNVA